MKGPILVLDSSFLWNLYGVRRPKADSTQARQAQETAKAKFKGSTVRGSQHYLPLLAIFECANFIAKIADSEERRKLAHRFVADMQRSLAQASPWTVTPAGRNLARTLSDEELLRRCEQFRDTFSDEGVGLVDLFVIHEARRIKGDHAGRAVHIWTQDEQLKRYEPDPEPESWWRG